MSPPRKPLEIDARWVFFCAFFLILLVCQVLLWYRLQRMPVRGIGNQVPVARPMARLALRSLVFSLVMAGYCTLLTILLVRIVVRPLLNLWLAPVVDPSWGTFHLAASEQAVATVAARRKSAWGWLPGALVLTNRRVWFFPSAWDHEPWSLELGEVDRCEPRLPAWTGMMPIRNWPEHLQLTARNGMAWSFALADPASVLSWFAAERRRSGAAASGGSLAKGVVDV